MSYLAFRQEWFAR